MRRTTTDIYLCKGEPIHLQEIYRIIRTQRVCLWSHKIEPHTRKCKCGLTDRELMLYGPHPTISDLLDGKPGVAAAWERLRKELLLEQQNET